MLNLIYRFFCSNMSHIHCHALCHIILLLPGRCSYYAFKSWDKQPFLNRLNDYKQDLPLHYILSVHTVLKMIQNKTLYWETYGLYMLILCICLHACHWWGVVIECGPCRQQSLKYRGPGSIPDQYMLHFWYRKWFCDMFPSQYHSTNAPYLFIHHRDCSWWHL